MHPIENSFSGDIGFRVLIDKTGLVAVEDSGVLTFHWRNEYYFSVIRDSIWLLNFEKDRSWMWDKDKGDSANERWFRDNGFDYERAVFLKEIEATYSYVEDLRSIVCIGCFCFDSFLAPEELRDEFISFFKETFYGPRV